MLLVIPTLLSFSLSWLQVNMSYSPELQVVDGTRIFVLVPKVTKIKGPALGLQYTIPSLICTNTKTYINVIADIAKGKDQVYTSYVMDSNGTTYCAPFTFNTLSQDQNSLEALSLAFGLMKIASGDISGFLTFAKVFLVRPDLDGIYLNVYVKTPKGSAYLSHYLYQRKVSTSLSCLKVIPESVPFVPGMYYNVTLVNECGKTLYLKFALDIKAVPDMTLRRLSLDPNSTVTVKLHVPDYFGIKKRLNDNEIMVYARDVKVEVCNSECQTVYAIPVFDYMTFFVTLPQNYEVHWYQGDEEVSALRPGTARVCFNLTKVHPDIKINTVATFMIVQNRRFLPDKVVASKEVYVNDFNDFNVCLTFHTTSGITVRGYKLVLEVGNSSYTLSEVSMEG